MFLVWKMTECLSKYCIVRLHIIDLKYFVFVLGIM